MNKPDQLQLLFDTFDNVRHQNGEEYWYARELFGHLGYGSWDSFQTVIERAKNSFNNQKLPIENHFREVTKMVKIGSETEREIRDIKLTRYACYIITLNGDPKKEKVAFAQAYFATQTRRMEVLKERMQELERIESREKLKITEKEFAEMVFSRGVDGDGIARIRSVGDKALFGGKTTSEMKKRLRIEKGALADFLPNVTLKAKDLATAMTTENTRRKNLSGTEPISIEHRDSNINIREALVKAKIYPEELPAAEDIKKVEAKYRREKALLEKKYKQELNEATKKISE